MRTALRSWTIVAGVALAGCADGGSLRARGGSIDRDGGSDIARVDASRPEPERDGGPSSPRVDAGTRSGAADAAPLVPDVGPRDLECGAMHAPCHAHTECCEGLCSGGYCGGPERAGCAIEGVGCWSHGQCCSGVCGPDGFCVTAMDPPRPCSPAYAGCFFGTDCCSGVCMGTSSTCARTGPGPWLP